MANES